MFDIKKRLCFLIVVMIFICIILIFGNVYCMFERFFDLIYVWCLGFVWCVMFRVGLMCLEFKRCKLYMLKFVLIFNERENVVFFFVYL